MAEGISWLQKGAIEVGGGMRQQEQGPFTHVYPLNPPPGYHVFVQIGYMNFKRKFRMNMLLES